MPITSAAFSPDPNSRPAEVKQRSSFGAFVLRLKDGIVKLPARLFQEAAPPFEALGHIGAGQPGGGFLVKGKKFIHHTSLDPYETAVVNLTKKQKLFFIAFFFVLAGVFLVDWHAALQSMFIFFTVLYFLDSVFNLFLVYRSFSAPAELDISLKDIAAVPEDRWPTYTIFCPLYKEAAVVPQFVAAMKKLDYPAGKLQIMFLLEADDTETIERVYRSQLPENFEVVVVPQSLPKTKPKAMNYGLHFARGEYSVIYDAEDVPEPLQLKKAVLAFAKEGPDTICVQAKLNFYNPNQNLLTKIFTAEYSLWFDLVLPGLQSLRAPIPLGGTSNHFKTKNLKKLQGWDAFNVTEDCDLGIRLAKKGFKTAIVSSTTWEEANSELGNWYNQRSRWIKGYMQTFLVHMRQWRTFLSNGKVSDLVFFEMTVGGKVVSMFINPFMWIMTIGYFAFRPTFGVWVESFFPAPLLYMGVFAFVFGNFFYMYRYMIGCAKRGFDGLIKHTLLVPFYWVGMSLSAWKALFEIIFHPHYWAKTKHGLHLKPDAEVIAAGQAPPLPVSSSRFARLRERLSSLGFVSGSGVLVGASILASLLNFSFNALLGRVLTFEDFGVLTLFNTVLILIGVMAAAFTATVNYRVAFLEAKQSAPAAAFFWGTAKHKALVAAVGLTLVWLLAIPAIMSYFKIPALDLAFFFTPVLALSLLVGVDRGFLQGKTRYLFAGVTIFTEAAAKFIAAAILMAVGLSSLVMLSLPISLLATFVVTQMLAHKANKANQDELSFEVSKIAVRFPRRFFTAAVLAGVSSLAFLSLDVLMAKHYLDPAVAGQYAMLSLVGKIIFYFGSLLSTFIVTFAGKDEGEGRDPNPRFYKFLGATTLLVFSMFAFLSLFGERTVLILFGGKALDIVPYLPVYTAGIAMFTIANAFVIYHLGRRHLLFSLASFISSLVLLVGVFFHHDSIGHIVHAVLIASAVALGAISGLHLLQRNGEFIVRNLVDLVDAFSPLAPIAAAPGSKKILIFNWRDTKHVYAGGAEIYVHELAKRWVAAGHHVTVFCGNDGKCARAEMVDGVRVIRRGGFYFVYFWAFVYYLLQFRGRFDLIIDSQNGIPFFTPLYSKEQTVCLLHHVHQDVFRKYLSAPLAWLATVLENRVMPWAYRRTKFITISDSSKQNLTDLGLGLEGIQIVNPGVDLSFLKPGPKAKHPLVLYLGRLKAYKSVDVLLKAFRQVSKAMPDAELVVAGSGEEDKNLLSLAKTLGLAGRVTFTGKVSEKEKLSWLQRAWVLVNPSLVEGWGITTIEANACGVPVVAAQVAGLRDSVKNPHTGYLVPHGDVRGFSQKILLLLKDNELRAKMGNEARRWARNFDWQQISQRGFKVLFG